MSRLKEKIARLMPFVINETSNAGDAVLSEKATRESELFRAALRAHGAVLFRGFRVESLAEFEDFVRVFAGRELFNYAGGVSPRSPLSRGGIYTSTEYPPDVALSLHNELSYSSVFPANLYFCCLTAPAAGGETTLGDSRGILRKIDARVVETFKNKRICYIRNLTGEADSPYSWQAAFETASKRRAEEICRRSGAEFEWKAGDRLQIRQTRPATAFHPVTREEVWFNQADGFHPSNLGIKNYESIDESEFRLNCTFGDGTPIDVAMLEEIRGVLETEAIPHRWQQGDVLILDNLLAAHGRRAFSGARRIALAMT